MPARGQQFPDIAPTEYERQPKLLQTRVAVPFGDPLINVPHPFAKNFFRWNSSMLSLTEIDLLEAWFRANGLTFFSLYEAEGWGNRAIPRTVIGPIVALQMSYTVPAKAMTGLVLYDNGVVINASRYVAVEGAGAEGETVITFNVGQLPAAGRELSFSATTGRLKYTVWLLTEQFPQVYTGEGDLYTLAEPLQFEERVT